MWPGRGDAGLCSFGCTYKSLGAELQHSDRELVCEVAHSGESSHPRSREFGWRLHLIQARGRVAGGGAGVAGAEWGAGEGIQKRTPGGSPLEDV